MATGTTRLLRSRPAPPLTAAELLRGFDPLEPRDPHGKWTEGGRKAVRPDPAKVAALAARVQAKADEMTKSHAVGADYLQQLAGKLKRGEPVTSSDLAPVRFSGNADLSDWADETSKMLDDVNGAEPLVSRPASAPVPASVSKFAAQAASAVPGLLGGGKSRFNGTIDIQKNLGRGVLASMDWDGTLRLQQDVADGLDRDLTGSGPVTTEPVETVLHEMIHSLSGSGADKRAYGDSMQTAMLEEGFTELATHNHLAGFAGQMGIGSRPVSEPGFKGTVADYARREGTVARITSGKGFYPNETDEAESWCIDVAAAEGLPGGDAASDARLVQLADEVARAGAASKAQVMAGQLLRALGIPPSSANAAAIAAEIQARWMEHSSFRLASALAQQGQVSRSYDTSRTEGKGHRGGGLAGQVEGRGGAGAARRARGEDVRAGAARSAELRDDAVEAGGLMQPRPLPPRPPEFRGYRSGPELRFSLSQLRDPHGRFAFEHGRLKKLKSDQKVHTEAGKVRAELGKARAASKAHAVEYGPPDVSFTKDVPKPKAEALKPLADYHEHNAGFTKAQDDAAQAAARRALLAYSQKKIMEAITTPPDQMTDEQVAYASRLIGRLTGQQINEQVDRLRDGGVPDPVIKHVKGAIGDHLADVAKEQNADARQKIFTHIAAIVAAVALSLAALGFALPAVLAAVIAAFPSLAQEFIDFKHDFTGRRKAAKEAAKAATGRSALMAIELRRYDPAELRTAETPVVSTVHNPFGSPAGPGLFRVKGLQLPAYIQNVAHAFTRSGLPESEAIRRAVGVVQDWAAGRTPNGKGHVHPDVQAAALKAIAEWEAAKAAAHGSK